VQKEIDDKVKKIKDSYDENLKESKKHADKLEKAQIIAK